MTIVAKCDDSEYVFVSDLNGILQNTSPSILKVIFSDVKPDTNTEAFHILEKGQMLTKENGFPSGSIYIKSLERKKNTAVFSS